MATVTKAEMTHEETCGSMTNCGQRIGSAREGWEQFGRAVDCPACLSVRAIVDGLLRGTAWPEQWLERGMAEIKRTAGTRDPRDIRDVLRNGGRE